jgi:hypothetical protein
MIKRPAHLAFAPLLLTLAGCTDPIVGSWKMDQLNADEYYDDESGSTYTLTYNGTLQVSEPNGDTFATTWNLTGTEREIDMFGDTVAEESGSLVATGTTRVTDTGYQVDLSYEQDPVSLGCTLADDVLTCTVDGDAEDKAVFRKQ